MLVLLAVVVIVVVVRSVMLTLVACIFAFSFAGDDPLVLEVVVTTDIAGRPVTEQDYTTELAGLISRTSGGVSQCQW